MCSTVSQRDALCDVVLDSTVVTPCKNEAKIIQVRRGRCEGSKPSSCAAGITVLLPNVGGASVRASALLLRRSGANSLHRSICQRMRVYCG